MIAGGSTVNVWIRSWIWDHTNGTMNPRSVWFWTISLSSLRINFHLYKSNGLISYEKQVTESKGKAEQEQNSELNKNRAALGILVAEMTVPAGCCRGNDVTPAVRVPVSHETAKRQIPRTDACLAQSWLLAWGSEAFCLTVYQDCLLLLQGRYSKNNLGGNRSLAGVYSRCLLCESGERNLNQRYLYMHVDACVMHIPSVVTSSLLLSQVWN